MQLYRKLAKVGRFFSHFTLRICLYERLKTTGIVVDMCKVNAITLFHASVKNDTRIPLRSICTQSSYLGSEIR